MLGILNGEKAAKALPKAQRMFFVSKHFGRLRHGCPEPEPTKENRIRVPPPAARILTLATSQKRKKKSSGLAGMKPYGLKRMKMNLKKGFEIWGDDSYQYRLHKRLISGANSTVWVQGCGWDALDFG